MIEQAVKTDNTFAEFKNMPKILVLLLTSLLLTACQGEIDNVLDRPQRIEVSVFKNEQASKKYVLTEKDQEYQAIKRWLKRNKSGWNSSPVTYLPYITVTGNDFTINFTKTLAIINYRGQQFVKRITKKDCTSLIRTCS